jgi:hypothetical protein
MTAQVAGGTAPRSLRSWRYGPPEDVITPDASLRLRAAWLAGDSAVRIAVMLDTREGVVRIEARRLGLPRRSRGRVTRVAPR